MTEFWKYSFRDTPEFVATFDELPLWSAPFGLMLLNHIELKRYEAVVDIGCGTGFPLFELAERLGPDCTVYGVDPWLNAIERAKLKSVQYNAESVILVERSAEQLPFPENSIDLVVSNLGVNNFDEPGTVFNDCRRVLKDGGKLAITTNLNGHWKLFYEVFEQTLIQAGQNDLLPALRAQQEHRGTVETTSQMFIEAGFTITRSIEDSFDMRFLDGTAFLNHHFIKLGWLSSWQKLIPQEKWNEVFPLLEINLNKYAESNNSLMLTVPMAFIEGEK